MLEHTTYCFVNIWYIIMLQLPCFSHNKAYFFLFFCSSVDNLLPWSQLDKEKMLFNNRLLPCGGLYIKTPMDFCLGGSNFKEPFLYIIITLGCFTKFTLFHTLLEYLFSLSLYYTYIIYCSKNFLILIIKIKEIE